MLPWIGFLSFSEGAVVDVKALFLQLPVESVPISTKVVSWNLAHGEVYSMQHYILCDKVCQ
jgi:hypothetical protein